MSITVEPLFLPQFRIFGVLIILFGVPGFLALLIPLIIKIILWLIVLGIGLFLLAGTQILEINKDQKQYRSAVSFFGLINFGGWKTYLSLENIFIKQAKASQKMAIGPIQNTVRMMVFDAYLKLSENEKIYLGTAKSKERLLKKIEPLKVYLEIPILDLSK
tara:strand:- start:4228 stop:4710 length:483 start_codon:yes stop_codon:yes gene_type:complete